MTLLRRPTVRGTLLWAALATLIVVETLNLGDSTGPGEPSLWQSVGGLVALSLAWLFLTSWTALSLALVAVLVGVTWLLDGTTDVYMPASYLIALVVVSWLAGRRSDGVVGVVAVVVGLVIALPPLRLATADADSIDTLTATVAETVANAFLLVVLPWLFGRYQQYQARLRVAAQERAERVAREHDLAVEQARLRERAAIAQDMHDSLGHELSLVALRAGALELAPDLAEGHRVAAGDLRLSASRATERLGEIVGVLRTGSVSLSPPHDSLADLVDRAAASGLDVRAEGVQAETDLTPAARQAAHHIVQESLTNAAKHAPGAPATVRLSRQGERVRLDVVNGPGTRTAEPPPPSGHHGLVGLTERARVVGGTLRAGRTPDGGHEVVAVLPCTDTRRTAEEA